MNTITPNKINPRSDKYYIDNTSNIIDNINDFPSFLKSIKFELFRHLKDVELNFAHPISVISGTNKSGKSTVLMALACSHLNFYQKDVRNGNSTRHTWSDLMKFTSSDVQSEDWTYYVTYRIGKKQETKRGQRKHSTKKWNGIGKKESQFKERSVIFKDVDRIVPARRFNNIAFSKSRQAEPQVISSKVENKAVIESCISYIFEMNFNINKLFSYNDKDVFDFNNSNNYSSFNSATGEDVLVSIIVDIVEAQKNSLVLIDEIELGLHPKIQRRLMDVIYYIAKKDGKQFIITTHSPSILSSVPAMARIFIDKNSIKTNISINEVLSKMDSESYPLIDIYCEDDISQKIISEAIKDIQELPEFKSYSKLMNIIICGSADKVYSFFKCHKEIYDKSIRAGYACILDGDMRNEKDKNNNKQYDDNELLHFLYSESPPEKFLTKAYLSVNNNEQIKFHADESNVHCLFEKFIEQGIAIDKDHAFNICWGVFKQSDEGVKYFEELKDFLINSCKKFAEDL